MTVEELINELMANCQSLDDAVEVHDAGPVIRLDGDKEGTVRINYYPEKGE